MLDEARRMAPSLSRGMSIWLVPWESQTGIEVGLTSMEDALRSQRSNCAPWSDRKRQQGADKTGEVKRKTRPPPLLARKTLFQNVRCAIIRLAYYTIDGYLEVGEIRHVIESFADDETEKLWGGTRSRRLPPDIQQRALMKLQLINAAVELDFLKLPPGNRLDALKGSRAGQYSIRINDQWRICFIWAGANAEQVEIVDYH